MRIVGIALALALAACVLLPPPASAGEEDGVPDCCAHCGACAPCQPVTCQVVAGMAKVKKHTFLVESEPFCPPLPGSLPSVPGALGHVLGKLGLRSHGCGDCGEGCGHAKGLTPPKCGHVRTRKVLVKKDYECEVPVYKCVVKGLCHECSADPAVIGPQPAPGPAPAPAPPPAPGPIPPPPAPLPGQQAYDFLPLPPT